MKQNYHLNFNPFNTLPKKLSGSENHKRKLRQQELQKSGKHFSKIFKTAQNTDSALTSGSELVN
jgi:hypothetical protein